MVKRRGNNEGSIYRRANGMWQAQVSIGGKRIGKTLNTKQECQDWLRKMHTPKSNGLSFSDASTNVKNYLENWLISVKPNLKDKTWRQYKGIVEQHVNPSLGSIRLIELFPWHIQSFYSEKIAGGTGARTVQLIHQVLHKALQDAKQLGMVATNPISVVSRPKTANKEMKFLTDHEVRRLLTAVQGNRIEALFQLAVTTGMRQGELLGLKWSDIDWASATIRVSRQLQRVPGEGLVLAQPKTAKSIRTVQLGPDTLRKLMEHRNSQEIEFRREVIHDDLVFLTRDEKPLGPRRVWGEFKSILKKAELKDIRFHDLRHTAASLMLSSGMAIIKVAHQLGHSRPSTTLDTYSHLIPGFDMDAGARIDQLVNPNATELQQAIDFSALEPSRNKEST